MKKLLVVIMILVLSVSFAFAEDMDVKKMDAGLRGGIRYGVTGRYFMENNAIEALITMRGSGIILTGMYQWHKPLVIGEVEGLSWYFGGGVHVGYYSLGDWFARNDISLGLDAIAGVEYDLEPLISFPLTVSLDYKPGFDIIGGWAGTFADFAISVRYAF
jgi:opacity protein-like surface antigen